MIAADAAVLQHNLFSVHLSPVSVYLSPAEEGGLVELLWTFIAVRNIIIEGQCMLKESVGVL